MQQENQRVIGNEVAVKERIFQIDLRSLRQQVAGSRELLTLWEPRGYEPTESAGWSADEAKDYAHETIVEARRVFEWTISDRLKQMDIGVRDVFYGPIEYLDMLLDMDNWLTRRIRRTNGPGRAVCEFIPLEAHSGCDETGKAVATTFNQEMELGTHAIAECFGQYGIDGGQRFSYAYRFRWKKYFTPMLTPDGTWNVDFNSPGRFPLVRNGMFIRDGEQLTNLHEATAAIVRQYMSVSRRHSAEEYFKDRLENPPVIGSILNRV